MSVQAHELAVYILTAAAVHYLLSQSRPRVQDLLPPFVPLAISSSTMLCRVGYWSGAESYLLCNLCSEERQSMSVYIIDVTRLMRLRYVSQR